MTNRRFLAMFIAALIMGNPVRLNAQSDGNPTAPSSTIYPPVRWLACQSDDQCALVSYHCGDLAINKKYLAQYEPPPRCQQISPNMARCTTCPQINNPHVLAKCMRGQCKATVAAGSDYR
jgi:hypothetical protein